jgi:protein JSN1
MAPASRPESHHNLNYTSTSQSIPAAATGSNPSNDPPAAAAIKPPFGSPNGLSGAGVSLGSTRLGAGSPSHELGGRLYSKR